MLMRRLAKKYRAAKEALKWSNLKFLFKIYKIKLQTLFEWAYSRENISRRTDYVMKGMLSEKKYKQLQEINAEKERKRQEKLRKREERRKELNRLENLRREKKCKV
jgi:hypothetical protein